MNKTGLHVQILHDGYHLDRAVFENEYKQQCIRINGNFFLLKKFNVLFFW